ncbi:MAG: DNA/RNA nuclease SfsA [Clostridiaceae bacterium]
MIIEEKTVKAKFICRPNRFQAFVDINGVETSVHVPNTGRCREILLPGTQVVLREGNNSNRKTKYDLIAGYKRGKIINIDSQIPNRVVEEALKEGAIGNLRRYTRIEREKTFGNSRFDFKLQDENENIYYLEVKGVTLEEDGVAMFPDAPTERGRKHLKELIDVKRTSKGAGVLFLIQMEEAECFKPHDDRDGLFGQALREACKNGVEIMAYKCDVGETHIKLTERVPVLL